MKRRTDSDKDLEILVLRHQVKILERQLHGRLWYRPADRALLGALSRLLPRWPWQSFLVTPDTLLRGTERQLGASGGAGEKQRRPGRRALRPEVVQLIVRLGQENRSWGCVPIQGELNRLRNRLGSGAFQHGKLLPGATPRWYVGARSSPAGRRTHRPMAG